jgi:NADH:ubiquinone oxidoreductase subunit K
LFYATEAAIALAIINIYKTFASVNVDEIKNLKE